MQPVRFDDPFSDRERECLRLVFEHKQSKDIARLFGLSKRYGRRLYRQRARQLGVASRIEAAKLFHAHEARQAEGGETPYRDHR